MFQDTNHKIRMHTPRTRTKEKLLRHKPHMMGTEPLRGILMGIQQNSMVRLRRMEPPQEGMAVTTSYC